MLICGLFYCCSVWWRVLLGMVFMVLFFNFMFSVFVGLIIFFILLLLILILVLLWFKFVVKGLMLCLFWVWVMLLMYVGVCDVGCCRCDVGKLFGVFVREVKLLRVKWRLWMMLICICFFYSVLICFVLDR